MEIQYYLGFCGDFCYADSILSMEYTYTQKRYINYWELSGMGILGQCILTNSESSPDACGIRISCYGSMVIFCSRNRCRWWRKNKKSKKYYYLCYYRISLDQDTIRYCKSILLTTRLWIYWWWIHICWNLRYQRSGPRERYRHRG